MEIYAFGSIVRGEIDENSDIDLLILKEKNEKLFNINKEEFSIYTYERLLELWNEGNPFAWHLYSESKVIFSNNEIPFIFTLKTPNKYKSLKIDLLKFYDLFTSSKSSLLSNNFSTDFDLSMIFLAIRNFASCFSLGYLNVGEFSRDSALKIGANSISINEKVYLKLKEARILATRGIGEKVSNENLTNIVNELPMIENWFNRLLKNIE